MYMEFYQYIIEMLFMSHFQLLQYETNISVYKVSTRVSYQLKYEMIHCIQNVPTSDK